MESGVRRRLSIDEEIRTRSQYWKLSSSGHDHLNFKEHVDEEDSIAPGDRPITCFLYPGLTPSKLYDHLKSRSASDACIVEWMRRLQKMRQESSEHVVTDKTYGIKLLGK